MEIEIEEVLKKYPPLTAQAFCERVQQIFPDTRFQRLDFIESQFPPVMLGLYAAAVARVKAGTNARLVKMEDSNCHVNSDKLKTKNPTWTRFTGFALGPDDDCWRVHSWLENTQGRIVETTSIRKKYFGLPR